MAYKTIHLFAGAGGGILADLLTGDTPIAACEIEEYPRKVLLARQRDGFLPEFPIWDDIRTLRSDNQECSAAFDAWRAIRNELAICGGFPCQNISSAGDGTGIAGEKSGLWKEMARVIGEIRPARVRLENSPILTSRGLGVVLGDLAEMGYDARWGVVSAADFGAEHVRERIFISAYANGSQLEGGSISRRVYQENPNLGYARWGKDKPGVDRMVNGLAFQLDRLKAIGNGQVPICAAMAWSILENES